ncbi:RagB/SusD family nutrient uptake outer membrane protein [Gracilimonas sp. Q87]|uniref:RagB/SusD family nutrient uptake outer membrane protein n=1 Tax=Gracilimonas sp. Q87 TaxID=3384766 RepID=UPI003983E978
MKKLLSIFTILIFIYSCDVENPGPIAESALNTPSAVPGLVVGMSADLSFAYRTTTRWGSVWADELTHSGTFSAPTIFSTGSIYSEDINPWWEDAQRARWVAENGIERIRETLGNEFDSNEYVAKAHLYAGYSNRMLGENVCFAVIDGGPREDYTVHFERAESYFTDAITIATNLNDQNLLNAAIAGRASARAALGDWVGAAADAEDVPVEYRFEAIYSTNSGRENNDWPPNTINRGEYSVFGTQWEGLNDPRLPQQVIYDASNDTATAANGTTPWITQLKYESDADNIALSKGTEMLLIRAEMELRENQDFNTAMGYINQGRNYHGLGALTANDIAEAWGHLQDERGKDMWLEGRRFFDLRRWNDETGAANNTFLDGRDKCVPIGQSELEMNPNL